MGELSWLSTDPRDPYKLMKNFCFRPGYRKNEVTLHMDKIQPGQKCETPIGNIYLRMEKSEQNLSTAFIAKVNYINQLELSLQAKYLSTPSHKWPFDRDFLAAVHLVPGQKDESPVEIIRSDSAPELPMQQLQPGG